MSEINLSPRGVELLEQQLREARRKAAEFNDALPAATAAIDTGVPFERYRAIGGPRIGRGARPRSGRRTRRG